MASVKKRPDGSWRARYRDPNGKERAHHASTRARAQAWLDQQTAKLVRGEWVDPRSGRRTLRSYSEEWLARMRPGWRPGTDENVTTNIERHVLPVLGDRSLTSIREADIEALCASLELARRPSQVFASTLASCWLPRWRTI
jgi:hypothetical protein